nr:hypothetical protein [Tanacetum cinerariifolium]
RIEFVLGNSLFAMEGDKYETVFKSLGGYRELSLVRVNMETLAPILCIDANVIDCWVALLNFEELSLGYPIPTRHFFHTGCIVFFPIYASDHFYVVVFNIKKPKTMVILDNSDSGYGYALKYKEACDPLKKLFSRVSMIVDAIKNKNNRDPPKQVKETESENAVVGVNEVVDQVKEKRHRKK